MRELLRKFINGLDRLSLPAEPAPAPSFGFPDDLAVEMATSALTASRHNPNYLSRPGLVRAIHTAAEVLERGLDQAESFDAAVEILTMLADSLPSDVGASANPAMVELIGEACDSRRLILQIAHVCLDNAIDPWAIRIRQNDDRHFKAGFLDDLSRMLADRDCLSTSVADGTADLLAKLLQGTPFPAMLRIKVPLVIPQIQARSDTWIVGPKGSGKSRLLHGNLAADLAAGYGCLVLDTQGDFGAEQLRHCGLPASRIVFINPSDPRFRPRINLCRMGEITRIMESMGADISAPQRGILKYLGRIIRAVPDPTLAKLTEILGSRMTLERYMPLFDRTLIEWIKAHWDDPQYEVSRKALSRRLFDLQASEALGGMFGAEDVNIDLGAELDAGKLVIIRLDKRALGDELAVVATTFLAMALTAMWSRPIGDYDNPPLDWRIYLDEFVDILSESGGHAVLLDFLAQARKFNVGLVIAHQQRRQLPPALIEGMKNSQVRFCARMEPDEAAAMAKAMNCPTAFLQGLRRHPGSHGEFAVWIEDRLPAAVMLEVPYNPKHRHRRTDREMLDLMNALAERWGDAAVALPTTQQPPISNVVRMGAGSRRVIDGT